MKHPPMCRASNGWPTKPMICYLDPGHAGPHIFAPMIKVPSVEGQERRDDAR